MCPLCGTGPGTLGHRLWWCCHPAFVEARTRHAPPWLLAQARQGTSEGIVATWESALFPAPLLPSVADRRYDTFTWDVEPEGHAVEATFYPDASRCGGPTPPAASYGWAFVARDAEGGTVAAAHGVPPYVGAIRRCGRDLGPRPSCALVSTRLRLPVRLPRGSDDRPPRRRTRHLCSPSMRRSLGDLLRLRW